MESRKYVVCFDTLCDGFTPIVDQDRELVKLNTEEEAQQEIASDLEFYEDCFVTLIEEIGHKTI